MVKLRNVRVMHPLQHQLPNPAALAGALLAAILLAPQLAAADETADTAAKADCDPANRATWPECAAGNLCWCAGGDVEYRRDKVVLKDVVLYQAGSPLMVRAQRAETASIDSRDSTWIFSDGVQSRLAQGQLTADSATVHIELGNLSAATFRGLPATFEESSTATGATAPASVRGSARTIEYDTLAGGQVRLLEDVRLFDGCKEIHGAGFIYNLTQKNLKSVEPAAGTKGERVRGTFQRACKPGSAAAPASPP
jgi:lipopolysaccharide transport protein LptA